MFSDNQSLAGVTSGTATLSEHVIDTRALGTAPTAHLTQSYAPVADLGQGNVVPLYVAVQTAFTTATSLTVELLQSATENMASPDVLVSTGAIPVASLVQGYRIGITSIPANTTKRYLAMRYTPAGGTVGAGSVIAGVAANR